MTFETLRYEPRDCVARITLNRPDRLNAISLAMPGEIRRAVEAAEMPEPVKKVTISVGVACTGPGKKDTATKLLDLADQALYAAKESGRNCVRVVE